VDGVLDEEALSSPSSDIFENKMFLSFVGFFCALLFIGLLIYTVNYFLTRGRGGGDGGDDKSPATKSN
jgi:hypothetical protein